jgi:hypothetical protein
VFPHDVCRFELGVVDEGNFRVMMMTTMKQEVTSHIQATENLGFKKREESWSLTA